MPNQIEEAVPLEEFNHRFTTNERYRAIFDRCDGDNDGYICIWELEDFINSNNEDVKRIPKHIIKKIHKMADENEDQKLDYREFVQMLEHPDLQHLFGHYVTQYINFLIPREKPSLLLRGVDGQLIDEYTCCPPPIFMFLISILEFAFYLTDELTEKDSTLTGTGVTAVIFIYDPAKRHEVWRYLTYMFVHIGYAHLLVNLAVQIVLGVPLEMVHKWWRVLTIYFAGVIAGSLTNSITDPMCRLAGASGGVYSLLTAHIACVILNWRQMMYPYVQLFIYLVVVVCDLGQAVYNRFFLDVKSQVGISAHLGGAIAGLLVGIYTLRNLHVTRTEKYIWWMALILYIILMGIAIIMNIGWPRYFTN
ncbi:hypothetical protein NQ314_003475 [Rhamnusium bicolor]|uniref:EF-hand domain-containing protein n=1 Tax=Rhamnusium bicolor TaxID=1586634 RepID=A0AAV8ZPQ2_9CUCU|nr:hypothetical protein NQ314_003475 [Rhamnusium bicolor]